MAWTRDNTFSMGEHIIKPKQTRLEKVISEFKQFSPEVKAALIAAAVALLGAIGGCVTAYFDNSHLKAKVHDLEMEVLPFRNLAVQQFNRADANSLKLLAESMKTLHQEYSSQLETINDLRMQIERLKKSNDEAQRSFTLQIAQESFIPLSKENEKRFVSDLHDFFQRWPMITNVVLVVDATEKRRRLWAEQMERLLSGTGLPVPLSSGMNAERGMYELAIFYKPEYREAVEGIAKPFTNLFKPPITISVRTDDANQISVRMMGEPLFDANGVIHFK
jgi:hypothetical protein